MTEPATRLPEELRRFNWAAFFAPWLWGPANKVWIGLASIPLAAISLAAIPSAILLLWIATRPGLMGDYPKGSAYLIGAPILALFLALAPLAFNYWFGARASQMAWRQLTKEGRDALGRRQRMLAPVCFVLFAAYWVLVVSVLLLVKS